MFDGIWKAVSGKLGTETIPLPDTVLHISGDHYEVHAPTGVDAGELCWHESGEECAVDLRGTSGAHAGNLIEARARVKGDLMQLCYAVDGSGRPAGFTAAPGQAMVTVRYHRVTGDASDAKS